MVCPDWTNREAACRMSEWRGLYMRPEVMGGLEDGLQHCLDCTGGIRGKNNTRQMETEENVMVWMTVILAGGFRVPA